MAEEIDFTCDATGPAKVRRWLARCLDIALPPRAAMAGLIDDALVVTSELVTNAINAGCSSGRVSWRLEPDCLQLMVFDDAPGWPTLRHPGPDEPHGRGLQIIQALAADRGTTAVPGGKQAWAALSVPG